MICRPAGLDSEDGSWGSGRGNRRVGGSEALNLTACCVVLMSLVSRVGGVGALGAADLPRGQPARGAALFQQCDACHSIQRGVRFTGPSLADIWGHPAATVEGFSRYSTALRQSGITWDERTLDR